jgi:predicted nucleic acid-binding protein
MAVFALDTSCMVAAVCSWHEQHTSVIAAIESRLARGKRLTIPAPALLEGYAVLTRLPAPHRLSPANAWALIHANFIEQADVVALTGPEYVRLLRDVVHRDVAGGRSYDAVIAACVCKADADELLTLNRRHFDPAPAGLSVVEPPR